ncbi:hypothetical protein D3C72_1756340 [compost metagenome]
MAKFHILRHGLNHAPSLVLLPELPLAKAQPDSVNANFVKAREFQNSPQSRAQENPRQKNYVAKLDLNFLKFLKRKKTDV